MFDGTDGWRPAGRRLLFLWNRRCRHDAAAFGAALARLGEAGIELVRVRGDDPREWSALIRRHRNDADGVLVAGGDGSLQAALDGVLDAGLPLGVLPLGAVNGFARVLGLPTAPVPAALAIARGHTRRVAIGEANGMPFLTTATVGRLRRDRPAAGLTGLPFTAEIGTGGRLWRLRASALAVFADGGGPGMPRASSLRLACFDPGPAWRLLDRLRGQRLEPAPDLPSLVSAVTIRTERPVRVRLDGEAAGRSPVTVRVVPRALSVFALPIGIKLPDLGFGADIAGRIGRPGPLRLGRGDAIG